MWGFIHNAHVLGKLCDAESGHVLVMGSTLFLEGIKIPLLGSIIISLFTFWQIVKIIEIIDFNKVITCFLEIEKKIKIETF